MKRMCIVLSLVLAVGLSGCENWEDHHTEGTLIGGGVGAGVGALIGAATGSWAWGALIGAGAGALGGYVIADQTHDEPAYVEAGAEPTEADLRRREADLAFQEALRAKTPSESKYHLEHSIDLYPTAAAWNNLGTIHVAEGNRSAAIRAFEKALALDPNYTPARDNLNRALSQG